MPRKKKVDQELLKEAKPKKKRAVSKKPALTKAAASLKSPARKTAVKRQRRLVSPPVTEIPVQPKIIEERVSESKYYAGPVIQKFTAESKFEFPAGYGDNRIVLMVRDPYWLYAYWEVSETRRQEIRQELGEQLFGSSKEALRVYDTEDWNYFEIALSSGAKNWYIHVPRPNRTYCVDIGYLTTDGRFLTAARSNWVTTPLDKMSDVIDDQWLIPDWEAMYALSGGFGVGKGSEEIGELMRRRLQEESSSGWLFSISSPARKMGERPFWLVANCELIVYGATEPTATLTVQGRKIDLREDGTFSLRFSLPAGKQVIPIEAIRDDGAERRKITPIVERRTE